MRQLHQARDDQHTGACPRDDCDWEHGCINKKLVDSARAAGLLTYERVVSSGRVVPRCLACGATHSTCASSKRNCAELTGDEMCLIPSGSTMTGGSRLAQRLRLDARSVLGLVVEVPLRARFVKQNAKADGVSYQFVVDGDQVVRDRGGAVVVLRDGDFVFFNKDADVEAM